MDMASHLEGLVAARMQGGGFPADTRPDWQALRARFGAAIAARRALPSTPPLEAESPRGSFDAAGARLIATYEEGLAAVNRTVLANGKPDAGISAASAGPELAGGRG